MSQATAQQEPASVQDPGLRHRLLVTLARRPDPHSKVIRAVTLASVCAILFAVVGGVRDVFGAHHLASAPFDPDLALRTLSAGWYKPHRTVPVSIVDIDNDTYRGWGSPAITPRDELARLIEVVTAASPAAVVVDIDLSGAATEVADAQSAALHGYFERYAGPAPLIFPKRIERGRDGRRLAAPSPFDAVFARNPHLSWAHASLASDGGNVRKWAEWISICDAGGKSWLPAVAVRVAERIAVLPRGLERPTPPSAPIDCSGSDFVTQRLLIGPRLTGEKQRAVQRDARAVSAGLVLDREIARDDAGLFGDRVVLIGATHAGTEDYWLTGAGVLPGVEVLANTIRYAPLQNRGGIGSAIGYRVAVLVLFALYAWAVWSWKGMPAAVIIVPGTLVVVAIAIGVWEYVGVFEAIQAAALLFIVYEATRTVLDLAEDWRWKRRGNPAGLRGWLRTLREACARKH